MGHTNVEPEVIRLQFSLWNRGLRIEGGLVHPVFSILQTKNFPNMAVSERKKL